MLNRRNRIGDSGTIGRLAKAGNVFKNEFLLFRYANTGESPSRFAVNVSKKIDKRAVYRNRLRRQVSEALRLHLADLPGGVRVLVSVRTSVVGHMPEFRHLEQAVVAFINSLKTHAK